MRAMNTQHTPEPPRLDDHVRALLVQRRGQLRQVVAAMNGHVSRSWIDKFTSGKITNPGYRTLRVLRDYLETGAPPPPAEQESRQTAEA